METTSVHFADELGQVKSKTSYDGDTGVGGVYNLRSKRALKSSLHDKGYLVHDKAVPSEDEDPGLRNESDYKRRQVRHVPS
jgi:hypothetical protein